jgi:tripartite-type tricarboxylate transporter receptor subunit TctC
VVNVAWTPNMIVTHREGATSLLRLIGQAKAKGLVYGSAGTGTTPHLTAEYLFKNLAGLDTTHVPYKGAAPAVIAALAAEVPVVSVAMPAAIAHIRSGKLRGLAVTSERRVSALPDVPTVQESGFPGFDDYTWVGVFAPVGTPASVIAKINADVNALLSHPGARERLAGFAFEPLGGSADSFAAFVKAEVVKWARVVRETGAKIE